MDSYVSTSVGQLLNFGPVINNLPAAYWFFDN
jgi:hypothetical protein